MGLEWIDTWAGLAGFVAALAWLGNQNRRIFKLLEHRFAAIDKRFDAIDKRLDAIDVRFEGTNWQADRRPQGLLAGPD